MHKKKIVGSAVVGNIIEYYDFGIYAVFATSIGRLFFPSQEHFVQIILTFSVFALGFLMRPLGGIIFGHIGDRFGRKVALTTSIIGMAIATLCIGSLPQYSHIGIFAPILLIIIRLFQGICIGGEGAGSAIFILEHLDGYKPGLIGSIVMASNMIGTLFATFIGIVINHFFNADDFSWRYGFILGGIMGIAGLYLRYNVDETPVFNEIKKHNQRIRLPVLQVIREKWRRLLVVACLGGVATTVTYMIRGYLNTFFLEFMHYSANEALYFTALCLFIFIITLPFFGIFADRIGYHKFLYILCYIIIIASIPVFKLLANPHHDAIQVLIGLFLIGIMAAAISAPAYPYAIQAFSPALRYSGVALSWNIGNALFGGTTPVVATYLTQKISLEAPAYYMVSMAILFIIASHFTKSAKY